MSTFVVQHCQRLLFDIVGTLNSPRCFSNHLHGRKKHRDQDSDNGDHNQQFNKRKRAPFSSIYASTEKHVVVP